MTHQEIEADSLAERYVMGKLSPDECARFEEHFVECPECLDRLETTERFRAALKPVAAAEAARPSAASAAWMGAKSGLLAAAALIVTAGPTTYFAVRSAGVRHELERAKTASAELQQRYERERSINEDLRKQLPKPAAASSLPVLGAISYLHTTRGAASSVLPQFVEPPGRVLPGGRSTAVSGAEPLDRGTVPPEPQLVILSLDREFEPEFQRLRATLTDATGTEVWQQTGLRMVAGQTVSLVLPSSLFHTGDYLLTVQGQVPDGRYLPAGRFRFRTVPGRK